MARTPLLRALQGVAAANEILADPKKA